MRVAKVYRNSILVGTLTEDDQRKFIFDYEDEYYYNNEFTSVSLTMPKTKKRYESDFLFPFFFNMLAEGDNKKVQSRQLQISEGDYFGFLLATAAVDSIGSIVVKEVQP